MPVAKNINIIELESSVTTPISFYGISIVNNLNNNFQVLHEITHQWFGITYIPCSNNGLFLTESISEYLSLYYLSTQKYYDEELNIRLSAALRHLLHC